MKKSALKPQKSVPFYAALLAALLSWGFAAPAAQAQGERDIAAPESEAKTADMQADNGNKGDFPPPPPSAASGASFPPAEDKSAAETPAASSGGASLWPSVAAEAAKNNNQQTEQSGPHSAAPAPAENPQPQQPVAAQPLSNAEQLQAIRQLQSQMEVLKERVDELEFMQLKMQAGGNAAEDRAGGAAQSHNQAESSEKEKAVSAAALPLAAKSKSDDDETYPLPADIGADGIYQLAQDYMAQGYYGRAAGLWKAFGARFGHDKRAADAAFQLGECYYARGLYAKAAEIYLDVRAKYKKAAIAPQNLLKLALSMANLQDNQTACATLEQLAKQYAQADPAILQQGEETGARLQCP